MVRRDARLRVAITGDLGFRLALNFVVRIDDHLLKSEVMFNITLSDIGA